jgi:uncharacterized membrane protein YidH (DUF202 family)
MGRKASLPVAEGCAFGLFVAAPLLTLAYMAVTILYLAVDIPAWDDWRQYQQGKAGSFDLAYLFKPANDTLYPVGKILDSVAVHALDGNAVAYKFLSMVVVLGSLLWLQWKLLRSALNDRFLVACCFAATMFMLCPDTYWDFQYMAFHQAVPLVCLLASLLVIVGGPANTGWKMALLFGLGLIAGLTYISGAVAIIATAFALLLLGFRWTQDRRQHLSAAIALGAAGLITSCFQAWVILVAQGGKTHHPDAPWATPLTIDFWMFALGKIARSLQLPAHPVEMSFVIALLSVVAIGATAYLVWRRTDNSQALEARDKHRVTITICLMGAVAAYLAIVCAGRALLRRDPSGEFFDAFLGSLPEVSFLLGLRFVAVDPRVPACGTWTPDDQVHCPLGRSDSSIYGVYLDRLLGWSEPPCQHRGIQPKAATRRGMPSGESPGIRDNRMPGSLPRRDQPGL